MTYYEEQITKLSLELYSRDYLCKQVMNARQFMDDHYYQEITLDDIASRACFSKYHFLRLFKTLYGRTPREYLTTVRIKNAKRLLRKGVAVGDVSLSVGFNSSTSFTGLFRKMTGMTPSCFQHTAAEKSNPEEA